MSRPGPALSAVRVCFLAALLVLSQLGAVLHELSHSSAADKEGASAQHACEWCVGYASVAAASAGPLGWHPPLIAAASAACVGEVLAVPADCASPYKVRAPPAFS